MIIFGKAQKNVLQFPTISEGMYGEKGAMTGALILRHI